MEAAEREDCGDEVKAMRVAYVMALKKGNVATAIHLGRVMIESDAANENAAETAAMVLLSAFGPVLEGLVRRVTDMMRPSPNWTRSRRLRERCLG